MRNGLFKAIKLKQKERRVGGKPKKKKEERRKTGKKREEEEKWRSVLPCVPAEKPFQEQVFFIFFSR